MLNSPNCVSWTTYYYSIVLLYWYRMADQLFGMQVVVVRWNVSKYY